MAGRSRADAEAKTGAKAAAARRPRRLHLPGHYLVTVKRPYQKGVFRRLLMDDLALWVIMAAPGPSPLFLVGVTALFFSLWSIYEIGYWENDACGAQLEAAPVLSAQFASFDGRGLAMRAWITAILLAGAGAWALRPADPLSAALAWIVTLAGLRAVFWLYNRIDKTTRVWLYLVLHVFRTLALAAVVPIGLVGLMAGITQISARWQEYAWYRLAPPPEGFRWRDTPLRLIQLVLFLLALAALASARVDVWSARAAVLLGWSLFLARKDIRVAIGRGRWLGSAARPVR